MFFETPKQSCKFLYISLRTSFEAPLNKIEQAVGALHSTKYEKYSSPIFLISNKPHSVPTSDSWISSGLFTILAPETRAILTLSVFLILLMHDTFPLSKKCCARSETPFYVMTISGFHFKI